MSELVEKVARAMYPSWWETMDTCADGANCESCPLDRAHSLGKARAAIAAVAEWLDDALEAMAGEVDRLKTDYGLLCDTLRDDRAAHAAERDRLAGEVKFLRDAGSLVEANSIAADKRAEAAEAEAGRLKAALECVRQYVKGGPDHVSDEDITNIFRIADIALRDA